MSASHKDRTPDAGWLTPPGRPRLSAGEIHVWRVSLVRRDEELEALHGSLSGDEVRRADRFHFRHCARGCARASCSGSGAET
jgi:hypothetical protein